MTASSLPASYFDDVYAADADPWQFETSDYERSKYAATLAALPRPRFKSAFEIGCSIGVLTDALADRCDSLLAVDVSEAALSSARRRLAGKEHVRLERLSVPQEFPTERFDLVLLSEVGYYWATEDLHRAAERITASLWPGGVLVLVHWTLPVHDYPLTGDAVHMHFLSLATPGGPLQHLSGQREASYRLDVLLRSAAAPGDGGNKRRTV